MKQYLVPYYIEGHPGAGIKEALQQVGRVDLIKVLLERH